MGPLVNDQHSCMTTFRSNSNDRLYLKDQANHSQDPSQTHLRKKGKGKSKKNNIQLNDRGDGHRLGRKTQSTSGMKCKWFIRGLGLETIHTNGG